MPKRALVCMQVDDSLVSLCLTTLCHDTDDQPIALLLSLGQGTIIGSVVTEFMPADRYCNAF